MEVEFVRALSQVEDASQREKACMAAIAVVEGWKATASLKRKRVEMEESLARRIASEFDEGGDDLRPIYVSDSMSSKGLLEFCEKGPEALTKDESYATWIECECLDGSPRSTLADADARSGLLAKCEGRLWQCLDRAGGSLERRKAISGVPEFVVDLCSGYSDSQQFVLFEATDRVVGPTLAFLASAHVYVVLYGGFHITIWRPTLDNLAKVARCYSSAATRDRDSSLDGESFRYTVNAGDTIVIPPGYPHTICHKQGGTVAFSLMFANPSSRVVYGRIVREIDDDSVKKVYARHIFRHVAPPPCYQETDDEEEEEHRPTPSEQLALMEPALVKMARKVRFRAQKRKQVQSLGSSSSILFGNDNALLAANAPEDQNVHKSREEEESSREVAEVAPERRASEQQQQQLA